MMRSSPPRGYPAAALAAVIAAAVALPVEAQRGAGGGPRGGGPRVAAPVDLTGYWVSLVTEDWRWRMLTPPKGDYASLPLTDEARRVADQWDPARDTRAGEQCKAYGAAAIMRVPARLHIAWDDDSTLRVDIDAGTQTRLFRFGRAAAPAGRPTWQGHSVAEWQFAGGRAPRGGGAATGGSLKVVTTGMRPGYLRKNGVPYSGEAVVTEYFTRTDDPKGPTLLTVLTVVEDPRYLSQKWFVSSHFKKEPDGSRWNPTPCSAT